MFKQVLLKTLTRRNHKQQQQESHQHPVSYQM